MALIALVVFLGSKIISAPAAIARIADSPSHVFLFNAPISSASVIIKPLKFQSSLNIFSVISFECVAGKLLESILGNTICPTMIDFTPALTASLNGTNSVETGPSFVGLWDKTLKKYSGEKAEEDAIEYIRSSIRNPSEVIAPGYTDQMPKNYTSANGVSNDDIDGIIEYIKTLK